MNAYNKYQGEHCGYNDYLLNQILKKEWGFDGFVISDFVWGIRDTVGGINGGCDIEMCNTKYYKVSKVKKSIKEGKIKEETINEHAIRIVRTLKNMTGHSSRARSISHFQGRLLKNQLHF